MAKAAERELLQVFWVWYPCGLVGGQTLLSKEMNVPKFDHRDRHELQTQTVNSQGLCKLLDNNFCKNLSLSCGWNRIGKCLTLNQLLKTYVWNKITDQNNSTRLNLHTSALSFFLSILWSLVFVQTTFKRRLQLRAHRSSQWAERLPQLEFEFQFKALHGWPVPMAGTEHQLWQVSHRHLLLGLNHSESDPRPTAPGHKL